VNFRFRRTGRRIIRIKVLNRTLSV
jgi:hypothetical protein